MKRAALLLLLLAACVGPGPVVVHRNHQIVDAVLVRTAVVPFYPMDQLARSTADGDVGAAEAAEIVSRIVSEAFSDAGIGTIPPNDLVIAFEGRGLVLPRQDVKANAEVAATEFGATAIVTGKLMRYREREGGPAGALRPASVHFEVAIYTAPAAELVYTGRFDQTQQALSENPLMARLYPGRGSRWLSAAELARWGADNVVATLPEVLR
ncbi:MAG: hypothetical protein ACQGVC_17300 [Myxococcota bacterium]